MVEYMTKYTTEWYNKVMGKYLIGVIKSHAKQESIGLTTAHMVCTEDYGYYIN